MIRNKGNCKCILQYGGLPSCGAADKPGYEPLAVVPREGERTA
jgi:hypothetical protein